MASNKLLRIGPVPMGTAAANIVNCAIASLAGPTGYTQTQPYVVLTHIRITNKTTGQVAVSLFIGATGASAAGTEWWASAKPVPANDGIDWMGRLRLDSTDYLTGFAGANTSLVFEAEGEIGLA